MLLFFAHCSMKKLIVVLLVGGLFTPTLFAQGLFGIRQRPVNHFKGTQWYIGVITGVNFAQATVVEPHSEFSLMNTTITTEKDYQLAEVRPGYTAGVSGTVAFTPYIQGALSARYNNLKYAYRQMYTWSDPENEENQLIIDDLHTLSLGYVEMPLQVRYAFPINRLKPFAQAGLVYGRLVGARKALVSYNTDYASGGAVESVSHQQTSDVRASYIKSHAAYTLGGGLAYNFGGLMLVAEANYQRGFHTITNAQTRYTATRHLEGMGHVPDDVIINALSGSVSFLFPLKFLTNKSFKPVIF